MEELFGDKIDSLYCECMQEISDYCASLSMHDDELRCAVGSECAQLITLTEQIVNTQQSTQQAATAQQIDQELSVITQCLRIVEDA